MSSSTDVKETVSNEDKTAAEKPKREEKESLSTPPSLDTIIGPDKVIITKAEYQSLLIGNTQSFYNSLDSHDLLDKNISATINLLTYQWNLKEEHKRKQLSRGGGTSPPS